MHPLLDPYRTADLGLPALADACAAIVAATGRSTDDDRVTTAPDARTLRYYQSLGILDRPSRHDGREAVYGYRHLVQAVATKLLQAQGYTLAQIQAALIGRSNEQLTAAVVEALGLPSTRVSTPPPVVQAERPHTLCTYVLAPGVLVTLDPLHVPDLDAMVARIRRALHPSTLGASS